MAADRTRARRQTQSVIAAAYALVFHWDDPHCGTGDGRFDAERWEIMREILESNLRAAVTPWLTPTKEATDDR